PSGAYDPHSEYFVYECDEYDRNFLHFSPFISLLPAVDYDHPDTYPTEDEYRAAFRQYIDQSQLTIGWATDFEYIGAFSGETWQLNDDEGLDLKLAGAHNRRNATLVYKALDKLGIGDKTTR